MHLLLQILLHQHEHGAMPSGCEAIMTCCSLAGYLNRKGNVVVIIAMLVVATCFFRDDRQPYQQLWHGPRPHRSAFSIVLCTPELILQHFALRWYFFPVRDIQTGIGVGVGGGSAPDFGEGRSGTGMGGVWNLR